MRTRRTLCAGAFVAFCLGVAAAAPAASLHQFTTADATLNPDDGFDPAAVAVTADPNVRGPASGAALAT